MDCASAEATHGTRCAVCAAKQAERAMQKHHSMTDEERQEYLKQRSLRKKALRAERKEKGLCAECGKPVYKNHSLCYEHYLYHKRYKQKRANENKKGYSELGLCRICGEEVAAGKKLCEKHLKQYREIMKNNSKKGKQTELNCS